MSTPGTTAISASGVRLNQVAFAMLLGLTVAAGAPALADSVDPSLVPPDVVLSSAATQPAAQSPGSASTAGQSGQSVSTSSYSLPAQSSNSSGKPWNAMQASEMGDLSGPTRFPLSVQSMPTVVSSRAVAAVRRHKPVSLAPCRLKRHISSIFGFRRPRQC